MIACKTANISIAKLLLDHGADPSALTKKHKTALHYAAENCSKIELFHLLFQRGAAADVNRLTTNRVSPFGMLCSIRPPDLAIVQLFLDHGADPYFGDIENGGSAFFIALWQGSASCVRLLLKHTGPEKAMAYMRVEEGQREEWLAQMADMRERDPNDSD